jgi:hypothetical protein
MKMANGKWANGKSGEEWRSGAMTPADLPFAIADLPFAICS